MLGRRHERLILKITIQGDPLQKGCTSSCTSWVTPTLPYPYPPCLPPMWGHFTPTQVPWSMYATLITAITV